MSRERRSSFIKGTLLVNLADHFNICEWHRIWVDYFGVEFFNILGPLNSHFQNPHGVSYG